MLAPNALQKVHDAIVSAELPDVLLVGYNVRRNGKEQLLKCSISDVSFYLQQSLLLNSPWNSPWSKVVKSEALPEYAEEKWIGAEDTWNWLLMLSLRPRIS